MGYFRIFFLIPYDYTLFPRIRKIKLVYLLLRFLDSFTEIKLARKMVEWCMQKIRNLNANFFISRFMVLLLLRKNGKNGL